MLVSQFVDHLRDASVRGRIGSGSGTGHAALEKALSVGLQNGLHHDVVINFAIHGAKQVLVLLHDLVDLVFFVHGFFLVVVDQDWSQDFVVQLGEVEPTSSFLLAIVVSHFSSVSLDLARSLACHVDFLVGVHELFVVRSDAVGSLNQVHLLVLMSFNFVSCHISPHLGQKFLSLQIEFVLLHNQRFFLFIDFLDGIL